MKIGIPREIHPGERRVAGTPATVERLRKLGFDVVVELGAGAEAGFADDAYRTAGAEVATAAAAWGADVVIKVRPPEQNPKLLKHEADLVGEGATLISFVYPAQNESLVQRLAGRKVSALALDTVPRITRAQKVDALSAMANLAGYRAVVEAAHHFPRFFTGQVTAAGKVAPAKVLVIGAGVAGLAAIGAARGLGAIVRAFDTRPVVKEQVQSMGADFLELEFDEEGAGAGGYAKVMSKEFIEAEMALFAEQARDVDIIITTALIPGKPAPKLIMRDMVESMRPGSVVVDLAAEQGGNCEVTQPGQVAKHQGVTIVGVTDLPSRMASQSSELLGNIMANLVAELGGNDEFTIDLEDEMIRGALVAHAGQVTWPPPPMKHPPEPAKPAPAEPPTPAAAPKKTADEAVGSSTWMLFAGLALLGIGLGAPSSFLAHLTVFVLAIFVGWQVIWNVSAALHTPLMSVTNAISGIIIIGGMLQISGSTGSATTILGAVAVLIATINIAGGFLVTQRMLQMFRK